MNNVELNQKAIKNYYREDEEGYKECIKGFRNKNINFFERNLEFPGWIGELDFSKNIVRKIMIIGEAPTTLKAQINQINIAFGLGLYPIGGKGELDFEQIRKTYSEEDLRFKKIKKNQEEKNKMWKYVNLLFSKKLEKILPMIYITDLCKCNDEKKNQLMWEKCRDTYLIKEIEFISPKLIIFQGWDSYKSYMSYLEECKIITNRKDILENIKKYYHEHEQADFTKKGISLNPRYGTFTLRGNKIHFFVILHQSNFVGRYKEKYDINAYTSRHSKFFKEKILKEILNIHFQ